MQQELKGVHGGCIWPCKHSPEIQASNFKILLFWFCFCICSTAQKIPIKSAASSDIFQLPHLHLSYHCRAFKMVGRKTWTSSMACAEEL